MIPSTFLAVLGLISGFYQLAVGVPASPPAPPVPEILAIYEVWVTAYSSTPEETDDTPFITASGKEVRQGIIAANFLEFGTQVKIPGIFGDEIFVVEDRMHRRKKNFVDVWMSSKAEAKKFGISRAEVLVLNSPETIQ